MHRSHKHQRALPHSQHRRNDLGSPWRALVENVFGTLKRSHGYGRVRYQGLEPNIVELRFQVCGFPNLQYGLLGATL